MIYPPVDINSNAFLFETIFHFTVFPYTNHIYLYIRKIVFLHHLFEIFLYI